MDPLSLGARVVVWVSPTGGTLNIGHFAVADIRLDWQVFNVEESDRRLVDLVASFGEIFPKKDPEAPDTPRKGDVTGRFSHQPPCAMSVQTSSAQMT